MGRPVSPNFGKGRSKNVTQRAYFGFRVDFSDIYKELGKLTQVLGKDLANELKSARTAEAMLQRPIKNYNTKLSKNSGRVRALLAALHKDKKYEVKKTGGKIGNSGIRKLSLKLMKVSTLDADTLISKLDTSFPPHHIAPFAGDPKKAIGQPSKSKKRFALWRIFEYGRRSSYPIHSLGDTPLYYTTAKDGHSKFHVRSTITWKAKKSGAYLAYNLLTRTRTVYHKEQEIFTRDVKNGVKNLIKTRTRFR